MFRAAAAALCLLFHSYKNSALKTLKFKETLEFCFRKKTMFQVTLKFLQQIKIDINFIKQKIWCIQKKVLQLETG